MEEYHKRVPKNPIKFQLSLSSEQGAAKAIMLANKITILRGKAGSGKSLNACQVALDLLFRGEVLKIILTRPAVTAGEDIGFLPGNTSEKLAPYVAAIYENMYRLYDKKIIDKHIVDGNIEVIPIAFLRGRNFIDCCVVLDEAQNLTSSQMRLVLGRLCKGSKMIICGDSDQIDLPSRVKSGFDFICEKLANVIKGFALVTLETNYRDEIVSDILKVYEENK